VSSGRSARAPPFGRRLSIASQTAARTGHAGSSSAASSAAAVRGERSSAHALAIATRTCIDSWRKRPTKPSTRPARPSASTAA
jgi:hypothetical protein